MKRTPLFESHVRLGAKMVPFAGWEMPLSYSGVLDEHRATRTAVGLFDVSHMGRIEVEGSGAVPLLMRISTGNVENLPVGRMQYALACNEMGGILDDLMIYRLGATAFLICANASNAEKIESWVGSQAASVPDVRIRNRTFELAQLAIQGPRAIDVMRTLSAEDLGSVRPRRCQEADVAGVRMWVSRSGYTGEPGFELYLPADRAEPVWDALIVQGGGADLKPCGLGCRDTLRLEMGYPLYGNDMDETVTPVEAALEFAVDSDNEAFIGREAILGQIRSGTARRRAAFELLERGVPRHGCRIYSGGEAIGEVTSGNHSPMLNKGIGMGLVKSGFTAPGTKIEVDIRGRRVPAVTVELPFYKRKGRT
jgi:aminomethyltransferase